MQNEITNGILKGIYISIPVVIVEIAEFSLNMNFTLYSTINFVITVGILVTIGMLAFHAGKKPDGIRQAFILGLLIGLTTGIIMGIAGPIIEMRSPYFIKSYNTFLAAHNVPTRISSSTLLKPSTFIVGLIVNTIVDTLLALLFGKVGQFRAKREITI